jgi:hypothetical protein
MQMRNLRRLSILILGCAWFLIDARAFGQNTVVIVPAYGNPAVSPYLNLGVNQNGLSNYQTLVKPMIDEREALSRQAINIQKLQQQIKQTQDANKRVDRKRGDGSSSAQPTARFMHYSHYFGGSP